MYCSIRSIDIERFKELWFVVLSRSVKVSSRICMCLLQLSSPMLLHLWQFSLVSHSNVKFWCLDIALCLADVIALLTNIYTYKYPNRVSLALQHQQILHHYGSCEYFGAAELNIFNPKHWHYRQLLLRDWVPPFLLTYCISPVDLPIIANSIEGQMIEYLGFSHFSLLG